MSWALVLKTYLVAATVDGVAAAGRLCWETDTADIPHPPLLFHHPPAPTSRLLPPLPAFLSLEETFANWTSLGQHFTILGYLAFDYIFYRYPSSTNILNFQL